MSIKVSVLVIFSTKYRARDVHKRNSRLGLRTEKENSKESYEMILF
jgi:hypothetical protein